MEARRKALLAGIDELQQEAEVFAAKVAPLYALLGWTWESSPMPPSAESIESTLDDLLTMLRGAVIQGELDDKDGHLCCTGGLEVGYVGRGQFLMSFRVEEWVERSDHTLTFGEE